MTDQLVVAKELLRRRQALVSMSSFRDYMEATGELDFKIPPAAHHDLLIEALEGLVNGTGHTINGDQVYYTRLLIMLPPGAAKSTYCSIQFILWYFARFPDHHLLCASNTETLAEN